MFDEVVSERLQRNTENNEFADIEQFNLLQLMLCTVVNKWLILLAA